jgi:hypothetical protein
MNEPRKHKVVFRFGGAALVVAAAATDWVNWLRGLRRGTPGTEAISTIGLPLKEGERFVPTGLIVDLCTAPGGADTVTYQLLRNGVATGTALVIPSAGTAGRISPGAVTACADFGPADRMALSVTGTGGAIPAHTTDGRLEGYIIGKGR